MTDTERIVIVSPAPTDPKEKRAWAKAMARVQIAMWVDEGAACAQCHRPYSSVDDFNARNPRAGDGFANGDLSRSFVDDACWSSWAAAEPTE